MNTCLGKIALREALLGGSTPPVISPAPVPFTNIVSMVVMLLPTDHHQPTKLRNSILRPQSVTSSFWLTSMCPANYFANSANILLTGKRKNRRNDYLLSKSLVEKQGKYWQGRFIPTDVHYCCNKESKSKLSSLLFLTNY